ncbi:hypothetical protein HC031_17400 [Planosporangium thailandense]|uniref:Uncharacterized protein n=1 Tax=Planosporangium thailandense TaxID=765197 RepID=A0ABX0Y220_9ACTN|nr:hypothetical protein [Planosporangium thailandense]NJC71480.1 hypothetical protein [Planosporangium thailandense]
MSGGEDDVNFLTLLPMAVVMVAGPQFVSAVFLAPVQSRLRDWMNRYSWVINEVVILFFAVVTVAG